MKQNFLKIPINRILALILLDIMSIVVASFAALYIRFDFSFEGIPQEYLIKFENIIVYNIILTLLFFALWKLYKSVWRYASATELLNIVFATTCASIAQMILCHILNQKMPRSYYVIYWFLLFGLTTVIRFSYRILRLINSKRSELKTKKDGSNVMLIGAGAAANAILKEIETSRYLNLNPKCIIDDNPGCHGKFLRGVPIVGGRDKIADAVGQYNVDEIIFAIPSANTHVKKEILDICKETGCKMRTLPGMYQLINGDVSVAKLKEVEIEDLLGRDPIEINTEEVLNYVKDKVVLVTGGGGSIGSELCRQVASHNPKQLIIFDIYENCAYELEMELRNKYGADINVVTLIGSIRDIKRLDEVFETYHPSVVFHAAAHKHVPLMEVSPAEAVKNNVFGTKNLLTSAAEHGVERFVQLSTDKAVNPTNVMGCTKRICEMLIQTFAKNTSMKCMAVRFGNVLGSHGSVIPLFEEQIKNGGPVTITHPDIVRYFMTIPEAAQLVLQAGGLAQSGSIYVLDMGEPVKIMDLATRLIRFYGYEPNVNMEIKVTGLRPGEKLYEELMLDSEQDRMTKTAHDKIFIAPPMQIDLAAFYEELQNLRHDAEHNDEGVVLSLQRMVGTYHPNRVVNEDHTVSAAHGNTETIDKEELQKALDEQHSTQQNAQ